MSDLDRAKRLYRGFREREPGKIGSVRIPKNPRALMTLGYLSAVEYDTTQGAARNYRHVFSPGSRPILATDGRRLYVVRGRFRVTSRGIVDINSRGREES